MQIDNTQYLISRSNYVMRYQNKCIFKIMSMDFPKNNRFWIMGITFFHNYYSIFDVQNKKIGFAVSKYSDLENSIEKIDE